MVKCGHLRSNLLGAQSSIVDSMCTPPCNAMSWRAFRFSISGLQPKSIFRTLVAFLDPLLKLRGRKIESTRRSCDRGPALNVPCQGILTLELQTSKFHPTITHTEDIFLKSRLSRGTAGHHSRSWLTIALSRCSTT
jgi:hypothetical protein